MNVALTSIAIDDFLNSTQKIWLVIECIWECYEGPLTNNNPYYYWRVRTTNLKGVYLTEAEADRRLAEVPKPVNSDLDLFPRAGDTEVEWSKYAFKLGNGQLHLSGD